jgi:uncharacterized protein (DUF1330 family)
MPAYLIADIDVTDAAVVADYRRGTPAVVAIYGGRSLARSWDARCQAWELLSRDDLAAFHEHMARVQRYEKVQVHDIHDRTLFHSPFMT